MTADAMGEFGLDIHRKCRRERDRLKTWAGLMETLAEFYPPDVFDGGGDPGPQIIALTREVERLNDRIEQLETILSLAETWRADLDAEELAVMSTVLSPSEWALATAVDGLRAADSRAGQAGEEDGRA